MPAAAFRFNAKRVFLTYAQCGTLTADALLAFLRDDRGAAWYCVGLEQHEDGGNHLHAYAEWLHKLDVRSADHFDLGGLHPNVQPVRNRTNVLKYVQKGGDYVGNVEATSDTTTKYGDILRDSAGRDDFLERVVQHYPRDAALCINRLQEFALWKWPDEVAPYVPSHTTFVEPAALTEWKRENMTLEIGNPIGLPTGLGVNPSALVSDVRPKHMGRCS